MPPVVSGHVKLPALAEPPEAEQGLEEVVGNHEGLDVIWLMMLHEGRAGEPDDEDVEQEESKHRQRRGHEEPIIHPGEMYIFQINPKLVSLQCTWGLSDRGKSLATCLSHCSSLS